MKVRTILASLVVFLAGIGLSLAADANIGTWKLNEAKSKLSPGAPKVHTVVYTAAGDGIKVSVDATDKDGKAAHSEWTGKYDGKDYPSTGDTTSDMRWYKKVDDHTTDFALKSGGKTVTTGRIVVSADGKSRTVTTTGTDASGKEVKSVAVYDKQ